MKFPSKFITFKESSIGKFVEVLEHLQKYDLPLLQMYKKLVKNKTGSFNTVDELVETLDYLYVLGKVELDDEGVVHYVKENTL